MTRQINVVVEIKGEASDEEVVTFLRNLNEDFEVMLQRSGIDDDPWAVVDITLAPKE